jgi:hypothetical protein
VGAVPPENRTELKKPRLGAVLFCPIGAGLLGDVGKKVCDGLWGVEVSLQNGGQGASCAAIVEIWEKELPKFEP